MLDNAIPSYTAADVIKRLPLQHRKFIPKRYNFTNEHLIQVYLFRTLADQQYNTLFYDCSYQEYINNHYIEIEHCKHVDNKTYNYLKILYARVIKHLVYKDIVQANNRVKFMNSHGFIHQLLVLISKIMYKNNVEYYRLDNIIKIVRVIGAILNNIHEFHSMKFDIIPIMIACGLLPPSSGIRPAQTWCRYRGH